MRLNGTLDQYLRDIHRDDEEIVSQFVNQFAESECVTEEVKTENQMQWANV